MFLSDSSARRRSTINAARNNSGRATMHSSTCNDRTFSSIDAVVNGPRPCMAFQIEISAIDSRHTLKPPEPKRTAATAEAAKVRT